ncbi:hypothetical protein CRENBAI_009300 [Crenichthys baileyi]|uniref:Uncharacterized protein n=1 Tax=Crenichthys baileyi TaxID=28760 RepID=A0AAV9SKL5_9TELE
MRPLNQTHPSRPATTPKETLSSPQEDPTPQRRIAHALLPLLGLRTLRQTETIQITRWLFGIEKPCGNNYLPLAPLYTHRVYLSFITSWSKTIWTEHEEWLNTTFPWVWKAYGVPHFKGDFPEAESRTHEERFVHPRPWRMECNTARTQCTIGLARRPCQELTALFHNTAASPDASSTETQSPPFPSPWLAAQRQNGEDTVSCSRCGISASVLRYLWVMLKAHWCHHCLSIAVDYANVTRVFCIEGPGDLPYISMTTSQNLQTRYKGTWTLAYGAAAYTFRIKTQQGGMYLPIISCIWEDPQDRFWLPTLHLLDGRVVAVGTHRSPDSPPPGTDVKGCQVSITTADGSAQTSVTTKSVTCQTSAGYDEEQTPACLAGGANPPNFCPSDGHARRNGSSPAV